MASSGMVRIDHQPAIAAAATNRNTTNLWRAESSMIRSIISASGRCRSFQRRVDVDHGSLLSMSIMATCCRSFQPALGIHQEVARDHDALAGLKAAQDLHPIVQLR